MFSSSLVSRSASSYSLIGEYIGMESCSGVGIDNQHQELCCGGGGVKDPENRGRKRKINFEREIPPPIPSLASAENQPWQSLWVLKRYYTSDGRLILREEKVRHHEYFRAHRSNGRLTLHLVMDCTHDIDHVEANEAQVQLDVKNINNDAQGGS
ncbi:hypothetical protein Goshw_025815 [Gossypium schwendimanii]|uniref:FAF domain-containing protein n=9 Tax=Gossypium TaxID=3633 RepID=A0A1U8JCW2_GOSHI|nr:uncharacterized protein LOC107905881 [Gossypium hirsutum]KAB2031116.1 hypothetical protein ES319_D05G282500v1 [Gossypium barbadense]MBA0692208.1 hypothetical protein [Gossypium aridum]MBA0775757.1 hypothetical protein [Gossypium trilobum]MBA0837462.1 hypothetical protein [Gossypium armourianum]MBA0866932.1 hypothetical protein [Gossypium schwendimanii]TYG70238.1 hypothetical protein ES288_D05G297400v1 [Gossypium darwinii]TYH73015.1 hypothetical protein ES332_D05G297800v1 [Gossypium toment